MHRASRFALTDLFSFPFKKLSFIVFLILNEANTNAHSIYVYFHYTMYMNNCRLYNDICSCICVYTQCTNPSFTHFRHPSHFEKFEANTAAPARGVNSEILGDKFHSQHSQLVQLCTVLLDLFSMVPENTFCFEPWKHAGSHCFGVKVAVISNRVHPVAPAAQEKIWDMEDMGV